MSNRFSPEHLKVESPNAVKNTYQYTNTHPQIFQGVVLNVNEEPIERMKVLHEAYELSSKLLVVSRLIASSSTAQLGRPYKDGILTSRNTFQKYFHQDELERYIEDVLDTSAVAVGFGIFYIGSSLFRVATTCEEPISTIVIQKLSISGSTLLRIPEIHV